MAASDTLIRSVELCERTGVSYRQLDYWVRNNVIPSGDANGSGSRRLFSESIVPRVTTLAVVAKAFQDKEIGQLSTRTYADIYDHYDRGYVDLDSGVRITWPI